jgi:hypothetical protein
VTASLSALPTVRLPNAESAIRLGNDLAVTGRPQNCQFWRVRCRPAALSRVAGASIAVTGVSTVLAAVTITGSVSAAAGPLPGAGRLAAAFGIAVIVSLAWGAVGWTGTVLKSAAGAFAVMPLWNHDRAVIRQLTHLGLGALPRIGFDAKDLPGAPGGLIAPAQPACMRPTAAFSIVGSSSSTAFAAGPSGTKLSSLVTRVIRPA